MRDFERDFGAVIVQVVLIVNGDDAYAPGATGGRVPLVACPPVRGGDDNRRGGREGSGFGVRGSGCATALKQCPSGTFRGRTAQEQWHTVSATRRGHGKGRRDGRPWFSQYECPAGGVLRQTALEPADQRQTNHVQQGGAGGGDRRTSPVHCLACQLRTFRMTDKMSGLFHAHHSLDTAHRTMSSTANVERGVARRRDVRVASVPVVTAKKSPWRTGAAARFARHSLIRSRLRGG